MAQLRISNIDVNIISKLHNNGPQSAYRLAMDMKKPIANIKSRLKFLAESGAIVELEGGRTTEYEVHPVLRSDKHIKEIMGYAEKIVNLIDTILDTKAEGVEAIFKYIMLQTTVEFMEQPEA